MAAAARRSEQAGFERVFVPPCPGDEGIAVGCAAFGWHQRRLLLPPIAPPTDPAAAAAVGVATDGAKGGLDSPENRLESAAAEETKASEGGDGDEAASSSSAHGDGGGGGGSEGADGGGVERGLRAPFWGKSWTSEEVDDELAEWAPWLEVRDLDGVEVGVGSCAPIRERGCRCRCCRCCGAGAWVRAWTCARL